MTNQELNEAVARKLGGERRVLPDAVLEDGTIIRHYPDYCGSIALAWELMKPISQSDGSELEPWIEHRGVGGWVAGFGPRKLGVVGDTAPMAICLAFLELP